MLGRGDDFISGEVTGIRQSLQARITLVAGVLAGLVCVIVSALVLVDVHYREAGYRHEKISEAVDRAHHHIRLRAFPRTMAWSGDEVIQILDPRRRVVTGTPQAVGKPPMATFQPAGDRQSTMRTLCPPAGLHGCMYVVAYRSFQPDGVWSAYVASPVIPWYVDRTLVIFLATVSLLFTAMMAMGVFRAVGRILASVQAIRAEMDEITLTDIHRRVPVPESGDEIGVLAASVNTTLDRLDVACERLRRFTADASHELRSPLTAIRTQVEEALMYRDDTDWPQVAQAVLASAERLQTLVTDLLDLARLDAGADLSRDPTDLGRLVKAELDHRRSPQIKIVRHLQEEVFATCDRLWITRLLANLLDNAERRATSQVTVTVRADETYAILEVVDDGAGIPPGVRDVAFKRFTRSDTSSSDRDAEGSGLGLAIAWQVAEMHGGTLSIEDSERGVHLVLRLPRCDTPGR